MRPQPDKHQIQIPILFFLPPSYSGSTKQGAPFTKSLIQWYQVREEQKSATLKEITTTQISSPTIEKILHLQQVLLTIYSNAFSLKLSPHTHIVHKHFLFLYLDIKYSLLCCFFFKSSFEHT